MAIHELLLPTKAAYWQEEVWGRHELVNTNPAHMLPSLAPEEERGYRVQNQPELLLWHGAGSEVRDDLDPRAHAGVGRVPGSFSLQLFGRHPCPSNNDGHQRQAGNEEGP